MCNAVCSQVLTTHIQLCQGESYLVRKVVLTDEHEQHEPRTQHAHQQHGLYRRRYLVRQGLGEVDDCN